MEYHEVPELTKLFNQVLKLNFKRMQKKLDEINMHPGQPKILHVLSHVEEPITQVELAKMLGVTPATINAMLKRMERDELITRVRSESDNRVTHIYLTEEGHEVAIKVGKIMLDIQELCFGNFTEEEVEQTKHIFLKLKTNLMTNDEEMMQKGKEIEQC